MHQAWLLLGLVIILGSLGMAVCSKMSRSASTPATPVAAPQQTAASLPVAAPAPPVPDCDANVLWFGVDGNVAPRGTEEQETARFMAAARSWPATCRKEALTTVCSRGCDDLLSSMLIDAAASPEERKEATQFRRDHNTVAVKNGRALYVKAKAIVEYAMSIRRSPRASAYQKPHQTLEDMSSDLANGNPCIDRLRRDFARIDAFASEVDTSITETARGSCEALKSLTGYAKGCVDCSDDRDDCESMKEDLKTVDENLREDELVLAKDNAFLRKK